MFHYLLLPFGISTTLSPQRLATFKQATGLFLSFPSFSLYFFLFLFFFFYSVGWKASNMLSLQIDC